MKIVGSVWSKQTAGSPAVGIVFGADEKTGQKEVRVGIATPRTLRSEDEANIAENGGKIHAQDIQTVMDFLRMEK